MASGLYVLRWFFRLRKEKSRMKSSKWIIGLMAILVVVAMAPSSFAQVNLNIFNSPSPQEIATARNAQTSDPTSVGAGILVSGGLIAPSPLTTTHLVFTFPATISSSPQNGVDNTYPPPCTFAAPCTTAGPATATPANDAIRIEGATGLFASVTIATVKFSQGILAITLPGFGATSNTESGSFRIVGVRLDVAGKTAPLTVTSALSSSANNYLLSGSTATLINALGAGIGSAAIGAAAGNTSSGTALIFTNQTVATPADATASVLLAEGFASAWRSDTQTSTKGTATIPNGPMIRLTLTGLPNGVSAALVASTGTPASNNLPVITLSSTTLTNTTAGTTDTTYISFGSPNQTTVDNFDIKFTLSGIPTGTVTPGSIVATFTMGPVGNALSSGVPTSTAPTGAPSGYVRFQDGPIAVTIGAVVSPTTALLIPYAVKVGAYDTGIAIANTTLDPFGAQTGSATPTNGTITFTLFPRTDTGAGTSFPLTTSATVRPGVGLATDGTLVAGGVWTGLVTDLMTAAGKTGDFFGYIFIQTNFLNAHGAAYIFNGAGFTSATPVLVLPPPAGTPRNATVEALDN
jgi:hypothetical protein